jgi:hypothetical protein
MNIPIHAIKYISGVYRIQILDVYFYFNFWGGIYISICRCINDNIYPNNKMNSDNCMDYTTTAIKSSVVYHRIPYGARFNNKTKSRCTKAEICELIREVPDIPDDNSQPNCRWNMRDIKHHQLYLDIPRGTLLGNGYTKSRAPKIELCRYFEHLTYNEPIQAAVFTVVTIKLDDQFDPSGALAFIPDMTNHLQTNCPQYPQHEHIMRGRQHLMDTILSSIPDNSVAQLCIITHGSRTSILVGADTIDMNERATFEPFIVELRRILVHNATILLIACETGQVNGGDINANTPYTTYQFENWPEDTNIASKIASAIPGVAVFSTPRNQVRDELILYVHQPSQYEGMCDPTRPRPIYSGVMSRRQPFYKFVRTPHGVHLPPAEEMGHGVPNF